MNPDETKQQIDFERSRFGRGDLVRLKLQAEWLAKQPNQARCWIRAYEALASAADTLDALIVRAVTMAKERQGFADEEPEID